VNTKSTKLSLNLETSGCFCFILKTFHISEITAPIETSHESTLYLFDDICEVYVSPMPTCSTADVLTASSNVFTGISSCCATIQWSSNTISLWRAATVVHVYRWHIYVDTQRLITAGIWQNEGFSKFHFGCDILLRRWGSEGGWVFSEKKRNSCFRWTLFSGCIDEV